ncbi:MAG TPA: J domain-containing protein [Tepidiformaceae bacterium]|nr:J domain-containing protein [Tepidiformaceae bacterium]
MATDFYKILGVDRTASDKEIRSAYRKLARKFHPDVNPNDASAETRFKEVNNAFEVLSDPDKRKKYDKYGERWEYADQIEEAQRQQSAGNWFRNGPHGSSRAGAEFDGADFGSIFDSFLGRERGARRRGPRRGQDVESPVEVTLEEAFSGTSRTVQLDSSEPCKICNGTGSIGSATCHTCQGAGEVHRLRRLEVKVPAGVRTGSRVRVASEGAAGTAGAPSGDLFLVVTVLPHPRFERKGDDLTADVDVPLVDAVLGGEVELATIDGRRIALRIPELTQSGRLIRVSGKGMPRLGDTSRRGDLIARVRIQVPTALTPEERALYEQLRQRTAASAPGR